MATNRAGSRQSARGGGGRNHNATKAPITHMKKIIYKPLKKKAAK